MDLKEPPIIRNYREGLLDNWLANSVRASLDRCKYKAYWVHKSTYREVNDSSLGESIPTFFTASVAVRLLIVGTFGFGSFNNKEKTWPGIEPNPPSVLHVMMTAERVEGIVAFQAANPLTAPL